MKIRISILSLLIAIFFSCVQKKLDPSQFSWQLLDVETKSSLEETDNFINIIRSIDPVQACLFFREVGHGNVKISFRSKTKEIDVNLLAEKFGGGGHKRASGALTKGELEEVIDKVVAAAADWFK